VKHYASRYSIGRRLAFGFGVVFALQIGVLAAVLAWLDANEKAHDQLLNRVLPRAALARELEETVFYVAVAARDQLLESTPARGQAFEQAAERARTAVQVLASVRASADADARYQDVQALLERYVEQAASLRAKRLGKPLEELAQLREATVERVREFTRQEEAASRAALERMSESRRWASALLAWLAVASAALFVSAGWLTARSIRRPAGRLLEVASAMEAGNWRSALALAPASPDASLRTPDEMQHLAHAFGAAAVALESREQQLQQQNEELQAQNEEIQAQNEEIQAQNEEIQAQSEEIQAQNTDLMAQTAQLREQARALKEADEKKNDFLGLLAHELRNPLAPMSNSLALLRHAAPGADVGQAHAILERQLRHLVRLIDDLLDVTRISRGKIHLRRQRLDLAQLLRHCAADLRASVERKELRMELALPGEPIWVAADDTRLSQVFGNILGNAVKFTDAGGRIMVSAERDAGARQARVRIADTGRGMSAALLERLFTPFSQDDSELARSSGGLGLGLALVKGLVELHGGRVEARSEGPGRGAEVVVSLPLGEAPPRGAQAAAPEAAPPVHPRRILIVEDNADAAQSLRAVLELEGHQVRVEHTGPAALEAAESFLPEVVLCDIGLPGMDGYEVARALCRDANRERPLLIALTGYAAQTDRQRTADAGFDAHFAKPPDLARLHELLARL
jgi:signal transduction histidine kinase